MGEVLSCSGFVSVGRTDPDPERLNRDDRAFFQLIAEALKGLDHGSALFRRSYIHQAHDSAMRLLMNHSELAETLVERYEDSLVIEGVTEDGVIAGVGIPVPDRLRVISGLD
jgi:hypothetical protein